MTGTKAQTENIQHSEFYVSAMERLVESVQALSQARDIETIMAIVRTAARELTGADGATFVLRDGDKCFYADENAVSPLWKGQRFPMKTCISGWVMMNARPAVIEDIYQDPRIPAEAYRPTFVKSLAMVPIRRENPVGAIGNYWARHRKPSEDEVVILQTLANVTAVALENISLYGQLREKIAALETSNQELSRFAWAVSHDLKSPLRAIDNLSEWIDEDDGNSLSPKSKSYVANLRKRVKRMEKLLRDVLDYARLEYGMNPDRDEMVDGSILRDDIETLVNLPKGFRIETAPAFDKIRAPRLPLQRIFCNLVDNAIKHHDGETGKIEIGCEESETFYTFSVTDDGPGVPPEYNNRIFEMFQTLNAAEGSGMGLALVKKILDLRGGAIRVEPAPRHGARFVFIWPKKLEFHAPSGDEA